MKEKELRKHAICNLCHKKIGESGIPMFWIIKIERHGVNLDTVKRQDGLTAVLGGSVVLSQVMGANENMTMPMMEPLTLTVCETCAVECNYCVAQMSEYGGKK